MTINKFKGTISKVIWFDDNQLGLVTEKGLFIYNINDSLSSPKCTMLWMENFQLENVLYEEISKQVFILDTQGNLKKSRMEDFLKDFNSLNLVKTGCISIGKLSKISTTKRWFEKQEYFIILLFSIV